MKLSLFLLTCLVCILAYVRVTKAGFCAPPSGCSRKCSYRSSYKSKCGFLNWKRCTRYRVKYRDCPCPHVCCPGYSGSRCNVPSCFGSNTCPNGGTCIRPNICRCRTGYEGPRCSDINECSTRAGGCSQLCHNTQGSYRCSCHSGYTLNSDGRGCTDVNECLRNKGGCEYSCSNNEGSFTCGCKSGYTLSSNKRSCEDIKECNAPNRCNQRCINTLGSYRCSCDPGFSLQNDGFTCTDIDECSAGSARCNQICNNNIGSYSCVCNTGYSLQADGFTCTDKDDCIDNNGGCEQVCNNKVGFRTCTCNPGFELMDDGVSCKDIDECEVSPCRNGGTCTDGPNSFTCTCATGYSGQTCEKDEDNCLGNPCLNGGECVDGVNDFTCQCASGFTGDTCESDINECLSLNGGCQEQCNNLIGSYECSCHGNKTLEADGKTCSGDDNDVFRRHKLARKLLPRGCATLLLTRCTDGENVEVLLSSTSDWYTLNTNNNIHYTLGIVFVEVNDLSLPISLNGVVVEQTQGDFTLSLGIVTFTPAQGTSLPVTRIEDCISFQFTATDIFQFVSSLSFLQTFFDTLIDALPPWLGFSSNQFSALDVSDLKTDLVYGQNMDDVTWCQGAPVIPSHLYSVFRFSSGFSISLFGNQIDLPQPLNGRKFCLIVDICQKFGGTVFLMIPEESRDLLLKFDFFKTLNEKQDLLILPRGIGLSIFKGVYVPYQETAVQLWNGDRMFTYDVFEKADLWIGGDVKKESDTLLLEGSADVFVSVPNPIRMLTAVFVDEWNLLAQVTASATPTLKFKLFNKDYSITFVDLVTASLDLYMSIGGTDERQWCGDVSNPPGVFLATHVTVNPFQTVPILKDWIFNVQSKLYAFVTSDPGSKITDDMQIVISQDIINVQELLDALKTFILERISNLVELLTSTAMDIINHLQNVLNIFTSSIEDVLDAISQGNVQAVLDLLATLWDELISIEDIFRDFLDETEFFINETKDLFIDFVKNQIDIIKSNLNNAITKMKNQVLDAAKDYSGFGLKFTTTINFLKLKIIGVDIELVYSVDSLFQCSRFDKVKELLAGERAGRFLGRLSKGVKFGYFLKADVGVGIGGAMSIDTDKFILHLNAFVNMLGIRVTGDLFISKSGLYFYFEGNVWGLFLAQIDVFAEVGNEWYDLTFTLQGQFVANVRKRRQTQSVSNSFSGSYLDAMKKFIQRISDEAQKKLTQAQNALTKAQNSFDKAKNWLDSKKEAVDKANVVFDKAVAALETAKDKLEAAKGPFQAALNKLNAAQKKVDNICKIKTCSKICIPGIKCKICHKKVWGVKIPYPCCKKTSCMFKLPNPICEAANLICKGIRALAYLALEAAKVFVKIPMLALDAAKAAVSVVQFAVDKSRIILDAAKLLLDLAKLALDAAKLVLDAAKLGLELVKKAIGLAANILTLIIEHGLQNIIDVRNCGFKVQLSTVDKSVFEVSCEVNAFKLGWKKVGIKINFKNILQSIWQAAKATINALKQGLSNIFQGRKKREIEYESSSRLHILLRKIRQSGPDNSTAADDILDVANDTLGFDENSNTDSENRIRSFEQKCEMYRKSSTFLGQIFGLLKEIVGEASNIDDIDEGLQNLTASEIEKTLDLETAGVDPEYLMEHYNVTMKDIEDSLAETKLKFSGDPFFEEISQTAALARELSRSNLESVSVDQVLPAWVAAVQNNTAEFFTKDQCEDFNDCIFYAVTTLYEIHIAEDYENIAESRESITYIEDAALQVLNDNTLDILDLYRLSSIVVEGINRLDANIVFCKSPPEFISQPRNVSVVLGGHARFYCEAESPDAAIEYTWYKDGELLVGVSGQYLSVAGVTEDDEGYFECEASNVVASITSNRAFLVITDEPDDCTRESVEGSDNSYLDTVTNIVQYCPAYHLFDQTLCECVEQDSPVPDCATFYQPFPGDPTKFIQIGPLGVTHVMPCAPGTVYSPAICVCVHGSGFVTQTVSPSVSTTTSQSSNACPLRPHPSNPHMYIQLAPAGPIDMPCAPGTIFSEAYCTCVHEYR